MKKQNKISRRIKINRNLCSLNVVDRTWNSQIDKTKPKQSKNKGSMFKETKRISRGRWDPLVS